MIRKENENFILEVDGAKITRFLDKRNSAEMTDGERQFGTISYTLESTDITLLEKKPPYSPYASEEGAFDTAEETENAVMFSNGALKTEVVFSFEKDGAVKISFSSGNEEFSEYGINFPFNFSSKLHGGDWRKQFLFSTPYNSADNKSVMTYLTRPDGNALAIVGDGNVDGWKMDYSPYIFGHFFINLKWLGNFDRAYKTPRREKKQFSVRIYPVKSYREALGFLYKNTGIPIAVYDVSSVLCGEKAEIYSVGNCDGFLVEGDERFYPAINGRAEIEMTGYGLKSVYPVYGGGKKGADCIVFVYRGIKELLGKNLAHVGNAVPAKQFTNLCEGWTYVNTAADYLSAYGDDPEIRKKIDLALSVILTEDEDKAITHCTIWKKPIDGYPAYNVHTSNRIQEGFTGILMMLDLLALTHDDKYYDIAANMCENYLKKYISEDGGLKREERGRIEDYTTVCAPMIAIVDTAIEAKRRNDARAEFFAEQARRIADFLVGRGFSFPTEGGTTARTQPEFEDGSISCTALSLLYYCRYLESEEKYLSFAEEVLCVHDAWEIYADIAPMKNSSLRWWETCWKDFGPSLCCGHCWTIWRAEADYHFGILKKDKDAMIRSFNGFFTNFSKQTEDGKLYGTYIIDYITGGGFDYSVYDKTKKNCPDFRVANRTLEKVDDFTEARYCYNRMYHTWFDTIAVIGNKTFFGRRKGKTVFPDAPKPKILFVADVSGELNVETEEKLEVVSKSSFAVVRGGKEGNFVFPEKGVITLKF